MLLSIVLKIMIIILCLLISKFILNTYYYFRKVLHVQFDTIDGVGTSIPVDKALNPYGETLLCWEMNEEPLPKDHGSPMRVIVPGYVGIRNAKWI